MYTEKYTNPARGILIGILQSVNGITCRHLFRTCRNAMMAMNHTATKG